MPQTYIVAVGPGSVTWTAPRSGPATARRSWPRCATSSSPRYAWPGPPTSPPRYATTPAIHTAHSPPTRSPDDFALALRGALVALHGQHPVRAVGSEGFDVFALGVQGIGGDHDVGQVERGEGVEQRGETGDLAGLALHPGVDTDLAQRHPSVLIDDREQV